MPVWTLGHRVLVSGLATVVACIGAGRALADGQTNTFVIAAAQGYGVEDCLAEGGECGRAVADAWCAAEGRGPAVDFGRSATNRPTGPGAVESPYVIVCGD